MTKAQWRNKFHRDDDWKKSEQALIKKHWKTKSDREISNLPLLKGVRSEQAVRGQRINLGFKKWEPRQARWWTKEEEQLLEDNYQNYNKYQLVEKFLPNRTPSQVRDKAQRMGLSKAKWTQEEIDILAFAGGYYKYKFISKNFLPNKTVDQIRHKAKRLEISYKKVQKKLFYSSLINYKTNEC